MLSRVADSVYWMSRYIERAENVARFIHVNLHLILDLPVDPQRQWEPLVATTGDEADFRARYESPTREQVIRFLTFDLDNPNSILACLHRARENARSVREVISSEMWEQINRFYLMVKDVAGDPAIESVHSFYTDVKMASHLFVGITDATMSHNEAWNFGRVGRLLERADKTARILDVKYFMLLPHVEYVGTPYDVLLWSALLKSASAFEMYRKRHPRVAPERVAEFLLLDREFPRAVLHCLLLAERSLHNITGSGLESFANSAEQRLGRLRAELSFTRVDEIVGHGMHEYLDSLQSRINDIGLAIRENFFDSPPPESTPPSPRRSPEA